MSGRCSSTVTQYSGVGNPALANYPPPMLVDVLTQSLIVAPGALDHSLKGASQAAVAVLIRPDNGVLFIRRSDHPGDPWSGHIALPGGRVDPSDSGTEATAAREVAEEVGVDLKGARLIGMLDQVASPDLAPRVVVSPYVYVLPSAPDVVIDRTEVAAVYWFSLERLLSGEGRGRFEYSFRGQSMQLPCVDLDGACIWGMTLRVVDDLLSRLQNSL